MSVGSTASAPYTRKKGVYPVDLFGVVLKSPSYAGSPSIQHPGVLTNVSIKLALMPVNTNALALSTCPFDSGCATKTTSSGTLFYTNSGKLFDREVGSIVGDDTMRVAIS